MSTGPKLVESAWSPDTRTLLSRARACYRQGAAPHHTARAPWPSMWKPVAGAGGRWWCRRLGPPVCGQPGGTSFPLCRRLPAPCWNPHLPWQPLRQGCWSLQAMNGSHMEYFPHRITISIVAAFCSFFIFNVLPLPPYLYSTPTRSGEAPRRHTTPVLSFLLLVPLKVSSVPVCAVEGTGGLEAKSQPGFCSEHPVDD